MATKKKTKKRAYEEVFAELSEIVETLESGELSLEESLKKYEQGVQALRECYDELQSAEKKITKLVRDAQGKLKEVPFEPVIEEEES
ncbi:MAG: exodeoxyribonuclease VII small subunit [Planctomycetota bacterium]|jgi:exodeoxyribonuclease VII small subunit